MAKAAPQAMPGQAASLTAGLRHAVQYSAVGNSPAAQQGAGSKEDVQALSCEVQGLWPSHKTNHSMCMSCTRPSFHFSCTRLT